MDLLRALEEAWGAAITLLQRLDEPEWDLPTPCEGWSVRDVAAHLGHVEGIAHGYPQPPAPPENVLRKGEAGSSARMERR